MEITRRDGIILVAFVALLSLGGALFVKQATRSPEVDEATTPRRATRSEAERSETSALPAPLPTALALGTVPPDYQVISQRKLFAPLVRPPQPAARKAGPPPKIPPVPPVAINLSEKPAPVPAKPASPIKPAAPATPAAPPAPPKPPLAVTGLLRVGDGYRVVLEHTEQRQSRVVRVGEEAFGYRVAEVSEDARTVVLDRPGQAGQPPVSLKLGENKVVTTTESAPPAQPAGATPAPNGASPSGSTGPSPGFSGRFDPSQMTPEQRQRLEEWRQRRGGRGRGD